MDKQGVRHGDPEDLGGFEVDEQFEFGRLFDGEVGGLCTLEDQRSEGLPTDKALLQSLDRNGTSADDRDIAEFGDNFAREFLCTDARGP